MTVDNKDSNEATSQSLTLNDIKSMMAGMTDAILEQVDNRFKTFKPEVSQPTPTPTQTDTTKPEGQQTLSQRLKQLEDELARRDEEKATTERQTRYNNNIESQMAGYKLAYPNETLGIIKGLFAGQVSEVEGKWLTKDGKTLEEVVNAFMATPFGQHLLAAPDNPTGSGTNGTNPPRMAPQEGGSGIASLFRLG